jgi:hypothetical protein
VNVAAPVESKVLGWLRQTDFFQQYLKRIRLIPQFPIDDYLRQLDPAYEHPAYRANFLLIFRGDTQVVNIVLEYDGFSEHFRGQEHVNAASYRKYYKVDDIERERVIESYGYHIIRFNRFNIGRDPVATLSSRLENLIEQVTRQSL